MPRFGQNWTERPIRTRNEKRFKNERYDVILSIAGGKEWIELAKGIIDANNQTIPTIQCLLGDLRLQSWCGTGCLRFCFRILKPLDSGKSEYC